MRIEAILKFSVTIRNYLLSALRALGLLPGDLVALVAKMNLHIVPIKPIAITLSKHTATIKTLELILRQLCNDRHHK